MVDVVIKNHQIKTGIPKPDVRRVVIEVMREILNDPDYGLPLTPYIIQRLKKSMKSKKEGRLIELDEVLRKERIKNK